MAWASGVIIQVRKSLIIFRLRRVLAVLLHQQPGEGGDRDTKPRPAALVIDTRKSVSLFSLVPAAAAVTLSSDGSTKLPAEFLISP